MINKKHKTARHEQRKGVLLSPADLDNRYRSIPQDTDGRNSFCGHIGPSMNPTLNGQDLLEITPYAIERKPKAGDVILFMPPQLDLPVVHRIVSITTKGIRTRGDNCRDTDPWILQEKEIYGRVIGAGSGNRQRKIAGGLLGRFIGRYCLLRRLSMAPIVNLLRPVYRSLSTGGSLHRLIPVRLSPRVVTFNSKSNTSHRLLLGRRVIGTYDQDIHQWQIRRPYRILVNESSLLDPPVGENHGTSAPDPALLAIANLPFLT